jgi:type I restriction enzyme R subunit
MNSDVPKTKEQFSAHIPALHLLCALGWTYLKPSACFTKRGSNREVILKTTLLEVLQSRRFEYKGELHPLSPNAIDQIVRELSTASMQEGLPAANERLYEKLTLGITVTEFMADGKKHQPTIAIVDWQDINANRFEVTDEFEVLSTQGTHTRRPDVIGFVNGIPLIVIEAKRPDSGNANTSMIKEGISQQLRNQRIDEIPLLFAYTQLLFSISHTDGRYGTVHTKEKFWARWREEEFNDAHFFKIKNTALLSETQVALFAEKKPELRAYFEKLWAGQMLPTEQDKLLMSLLTPSRLLEFLRFFVLFDRKVGKLVARYQQFFGIRALISRVSLRRSDGGREGG